MIIHYFIIEQLLAELDIINHTFTRFFSFNFFIMTFFYFLYYTVMITMCYTFNEF